MLTGSCCAFFIKQQEEVEKSEEVTIKMSDLVVYCQPRSKEKDHFGMILSPTTLTKTNLHTITANSYTAYIVATILML
ncbi:unnamed protein product [Oncorhynchus mykiss]|uniref:Uncharacterized protein n=1 Tax=Oncorhynchus mykiss TaxID=8022 RepID=A0A060W702_ONCMY|nr:unnamed protein product [Oncorhynchus mykiss]